MLRPYYALYGLGFSLRADVVRNTFACIIIIITIITTIIIGRFATDYCLPHV